jgi:hypothetical protein
MLVADFESIPLADVFASPKEDCSRILRAAMTRFSESVYVGVSKSVITHPLIILQDESSRRHLLCETTTTFKPQGVGQLLILGAQMRAKAPWDFAHEDGFAERRRTLFEGQTQGFERLASRLIRSTILTHPCFLNFSTIKVLDPTNWLKTSRDFGARLDQELRRDHIESILLHAIEQNPDEVNTDNGSTLELEVDGATVGMDLDFEDALFSARTHEGFTSLSDDMKLQISVAGIFWRGGDLYVTEDGWETLDAVGGVDLMKMYWQNPCLKQITS